MDTTMRRTVTARLHLTMCAFRFRTSCSGKDADLRLRKGAWVLAGFITACDALALQSGRLRPCASGCKREWLSENRWPNKEQFERILLLRAWRSSKRGCLR